MSLCRRVGRLEQQAGGPGRCPKCPEPFLVDDGEPAPACDGCGRPYAVILVSEEVVELGPDGCLVPVAEEVPCHA